MSKKNTYIVDIETDGLLDTVSKIHVVGLWKLGEDKEVSFLYTPDEIKDFFNNTPALTVIGHNFYTYDAIVLEKLLGIRASTYNIIDTLALSWYLYPKRTEHGLESWGDSPEINIKKVKVDDWNDSSIELYTKRVEEDVKINANLFFYLWNNIKSLYDGDETRAWRIVRKLSSILAVYNEQYFHPFILNKNLAVSNLEELVSLAEQKKSALQKYMPKVPSYTVRNCPSQLYKKNNELTTKAVEWFNLLKEHGLPLDTPSIKYVKSLDEPNAGSVEQIKSWLTQLGWVPTIYKEAINVKGEVTRVPQIKNKEGDLCPNIVKLSVDIPEIKEYVDLGVINHRIGILKGFLRDEIDNKIYGDIAGITNTLRSRHRRLVNLVKVGIPYGKYIRPCLTCDEGEVLLGCDIKSLENTTRSILTYHIDPVSAQALLDPEFDTHLDLAVFAGGMTQEESDLYPVIKSRIKSGVYEQEDYKLFNKLDAIRHQYKTLNYMCLYNAGPAKIAKELNVTQRRGKELHNSYWQRNYAVKDVSQRAPRKSCLGINWVYNHLIDVWFELRKESDIFSSLNQGLGSFLFYEWVTEVRHMGIPITLNYHDEIQVRTTPDKVEHQKVCLQKAMDIINKRYDFPISISIDIQVGKNYGDTH